MEKWTYEGENQKRIEQFLLIAYTVYIAGMIIKANRLGWDNWTGMVLLTGIFSCWIVSIAKWKNYPFRASFCAIVVQGCIILYAVHLEDIFQILPVFLGFVVVFGLYGIENIINTTVVSAFILFFYHGFIAETIPFETSGDKFTIVIHIANVFFVEYIVYLWTKRNREGSRQLLGVIAELKEVENSKDDFLANVSHEIRTPINTICGMSEIILKEDLPEKVKEDVLGIQLAGRNLMSVVRDILDFSELQSGNIELEEEAYNIASTVNDIINMTMARKNEKNLEIIVDCDANIPCVLLGDEKKIRRVIMNLVDNAVKFTDKGCVTIKVGFRKEAYGINLIVTVKDTGIGMNDSSQEKMFVSFNQVDGSRRRQSGGIGLGLAISHALAQKLGATITMKSKVGKGSSFKFVIPQKVLDEKPIAALHDRQKINVATYIDMEQFDVAETREEYSKMIANMVEQLNGNCHVCRNFPELQRRQEKEKFTHIFISIVEYQAAVEYFDNLSRETKVIVVLDQYNEKYITNPLIMKIYKPFYILTIVSVLNSGEDITNEEPSVSGEKFVTRDVRVLVVDDNRMNIRVIEGLLEDYHIKVTTALSGREALEKINAANFDFVFMDHMMPEMDGVETLQNIRHKVGTYFQKVPIIALTANAVAGTREMLMGEGFSDFLEKPVERSVLERVLKRNLPVGKIVMRDLYDDEPDEEKVKQDVVKIPEQSVIEADFGAWGLDVQKGMLYCNGKEHYIEIVRESCETSEETAAYTEQLFEAQDWKDYTIAVHGMKSALRSIGAMEVSDLAASLEKAGKVEKTEYILENHEPFMKAYRTLFEALGKIGWLAVEKPAKSSGEETEEVLPEIEEDAFLEILEAMEDAAYMQEGQRLEELLSELHKYRYRGESLKKQLIPAQRKIEKSDYISAVELIARTKSKLAEKEE